jgi:hypothetical protein
MYFWKPEELRADVSKGYARGHYHGSSRPTQDESSAVSERVQAIIVASDQYAKKALGHREFDGIGGGGTITLPDSYRSKREGKLSVAGTSDGH